MEGATRTTRVVRLGGNLSLLAATFACLALWGGISLTLTNSSQPRASASPVDELALPKPVMQWEGASQARCALVNLLLFWMPLGLGAVACSVGVITLACSRESDPDTSRRALVALILSAVPGCLCTLWYAAFSAASF
jgi:hypothetical protein